MDAHMSSEVFNIYCIGVGVFGLLMGYVFAYSTRKVEPTGGDIAGLLGTVLGGTVLSVLNMINCDAKLPIYIIGVALGYVIYLILLKVNWPLVSHLYVAHGLKTSPLLPWRVKDPCCKCACKEKPAG